MSLHSVRVSAKSRDFSPDINYSICCDSHSPNLRAAIQHRAILRMRRTTAAAPVHGPVHGPARARAAQTRYMNENWSSSLRLDLSLKNSGKSSVVVWKNLPTGDPLDTQTTPLDSETGSTGELWYK